MNIYLILLNYLLLCLSFPFQFPIVLLTGSIDKTVKVWDFASLKCVNTIYKPVPINKVKISDGKYNLIAADDIELIENMNIEFDKDQIKNYQSDFSSTYLSDCGSVLAIASNDGYLSILNTSNMKTKVRIDTKELIQDKISFLVISKDLKYIVACTGSYGFILKLNTLELYTKFNTESVITSIQIYYDIKYDNKISYVMVGCLDGQIKKYSLFGDQEQVYDNHLGKITSLYINKNIMIAGSDDSSASLWDLSTSDNFDNFTLDTKFRSSITSVVLSKSNQFCVIGNDKGTFGIYDLKTGTILRKIEGHDGSITSVAISSLELKI